MGRMIRIIFKNVGSLTRQARKTPIAKLPFLQPFSSQKLPDEDRAGGSDKGPQSPFPTNEEIFKRKFGDESDQVLKDTLKNIKSDGKEDPSKDEEHEDENSFENPAKRSMYIFASAGVLLVAGYLVMQMNLMREEKKTVKKQKVTYTGRADIGGPWRLIDMEGRVVTHEDFLGSYYLIYFGFCNCPDICPNSLYKLSRALDLVRKMPEAKFFRLKPIFVSVDPDRDDPARMKKFLSLFDKSFIGLTGRSNDDPELKKMMRSFKIYASRIELEDEENKGTQEQGKAAPYTIDHTIITYLMDDSNNYLTHLGSNLSDYDLAQTIMNNILELSLIHI
eukprot:TRINITY_DN6117_c0_g1_i4.p1 TRINITY_DN6117_c0_g1~~TRINITY_DN6117_c0_g1_i4.p1  ORF type:complete len:334 (+),score=90.16 TRINITY_DN6117_c0_g1_i4:158-1159(+)